MPEWRDVQVVTFDIFDTLLHRRVKAPVDVFELVRLKAFETPHALTAHDMLDNFTYDRMRAESGARARRVRDFGGEPEVTLSEIYTEYQGIVGCSDALRDELAGYELEFEDALLFASSEGVKRYKRAREAGMKIVLISDMYLPADWLSGKMERAGFAGAGDLPIFVSGEKRVSKGSGALYDLVAAELGLPKDGSWLHIGDNPHSDIAQARQKGLKALHADWAQIDNRFLPVGASNDAHSIHSLLGFLDTPQAAEFLPDDPMERIGYRVWGPLMFGFTLWLLHWSKREALRRMLFIARDGWLPQQLFDSCKDKAGLSDVNTEYFYMSRNSSYLTGQREWDTYSTWAFVVGRVPKSPERSVRSLGLDAGDYQARAARLGVPDVKTPLCKEEEYRLKKLVDGLFARALMVCRDNREELEDYYRAAVGPAGKVGFVDIGWHGNLQRSFVHSLTDVDAMARVVGLYLGTLDASRANQAKGLKMQGWMVNLGEPWSWQEAMVNGGVELMEFLLTADHGSTLTLRRDENGVITPVLEEQGPDEVAHRDAAMRAQAGVRRFVEDYKFLLDHFRPETICSPAWAAGFERLVNRPTREEADLLGVLTHSDAPGANHDRIALARKLPWKHRFRKGGRYRRAREAAFWKAGFDARNK